MGIKDKIVIALREALRIEYIRLNEEDGISGFVVSPQFEGMTSMDRQVLLDEVLGNGSGPLTAEELRHVIMIAALTPAEYEAVGARVRVGRIKEVAGGAIEVLIDGGPSDAE